MGDKNRRSSRATSPETSVKAQDSLDFPSLRLSEEVLEVNEEDQIMQFQRNIAVPTPSYNENGRQRRDRRSRFKTPTNSITHGARHNRTGRQSAQRPHNVGSNGWA